MTDIAFSVLDLVVSTGKYLFELKEQYQGLPDELEKLRVLIYQVSEFLSNSQSDKRTFNEALKESISKAREKIEEFMKDCKEHKLKNFFGSVIGKGAKAKLEEIASITKEINELLTKFNIEINQMSLEKLSLLADSESKKYDASVILQHSTAKQFWIKHVGKEKSEFSSWESFMNAVRSELTAEENTDLRAKLSILENAIKMKIAGTDGLVDVYEFNSLTAKHGWPQGLFVTVTDIEESYHKVPAHIQHLFSKLKDLELVKFLDYRDAIINFGVTWEKLSEFSEADLKRFLVEDIKMNMIDASKVVKAVKMTATLTDSNSSTTQYSPPTQSKSSTEEITRDTGRWKLNLNEIKLERTIGSGKFSEVYVGIWRGCRVAVKQLKIKASTGISVSKDDIVHEASVISSLPGHSNVIRYFGAALRPPVMCIVTEFCPLREFLSDSRNNLDWRTALKIIRGAAHGLAHIHNEGFIHGDIASRNVLLSENFTASIADFGLARKGNLEDPELTVQLQNIMVDRRWASPEVLESRKLSVKSDVYSFGIVLWEVFTRRIPYDFTKDVDFVAQCVAAGKTPVLPKESKVAPQGFRKLINKCWAFEPSDRPFLSDILRDIDLMEAPIGNLEIVVETDTPQVEKRTGGGYDEVSETKTEEESFDDESKPEVTPESIVLQMIKSKYMLPREEVSKALLKAPDGTFILRWSQKEKTYVLSFLTEKKEKHFKVGVSNNLITVDGLKIKSVSITEFLSAFSAFLSCPAVPHDTMQALESAFFGAKA